MKRLHLFLILLAVLSLSVAIVWAAEETTWGQVKALTQPQPTAKMVNIRLFEGIYELVSFSTGPDNNKNEDVGIFKDWEVHWKLNPLEGTPTLEGTQAVYAHLEGNQRGIYQASFLLRYEVKILGTGLDQLKKFELQPAIFEGQCVSKVDFNTWTEKFIHFRAHGIGEAQGLFIEFLPDTGLYLQITEGFFNKAQ